VNRLAILVLPFLLTACATFDNNEYARLVDMRHELRESRCAVDNDVRVMIQTIDDHAAWLSIYSKYLPNNNPTIVMLDSYKQTLEDLRNNYKGQTPSVVYCRIKIKNMQEQLDIILDTTARRPRS
jgi:ssDNA-specific exonuclease RecJ